MARSERPARPAVHGFWEDTGATKTFTHPLDHALLEQYVPRDARVLDYGCGYGRLTAQLVELGYGDVHGVDPSRALIERGRREHPELPLLRFDALPLPFDDGSFDAALLFVVLGVVTADADQEALLAEIARLVRPSGVLYLSDVPLQTDEHHVRRYEEAAASSPGRPYGVFSTPDGGLFRHHRPEELRELLRTHGFAAEEERPTATATLHHGETTRSVQVLARRTP
ncbi:methyltransferase type 11 [Streptomyces abyssalis]|uniref:Methyltransferase type 11 n=1 Tax=Streptomyces abyssalis TaxID=933944 RepID=A0A1E7JKQ3_9ACTN|nr:class I SAM-dependent methyltransferase [Streptomyces abyssalis]OEU88227.1 methyltransferase type 11 [Streptomyces abyssalis]OEU91098.1 methyltransferase type 11 [Streptomyces abyssalis]OEV05493.1 methyltransferase type 11 [Streptomyces nanshensis]